MNTRKTLLGVAAILCSGALSSAQIAPQEGSERRSHDHSSHGQTRSRAR